MECKLLYTVNYSGQLLFYSLVYSYALPISLHSLTSSLQKLAVEGDRTATAVASSREDACMAAHSLIA